MVGGQRGPGWTSPRFRTDSPIGCTPLRSCNRRTARSPASPGGSHRRIWTTARICTTPFSGSRSPSSRWYSRALWPDRPLLLRCQPRTIQLLDRFSRGLAELLEPGCSRLSRVKDAEQVFSGQLLQVSVAPPATDQFGEELGELGGIFQALRH